MRPTTRVAVVCFHCRKPFYVNAYRIKNGTGKYCSSVCYWAHRWWHTGSCAHCGKPAATRFCSPDCQKQYWNKNGYDLQKRRQNWERKLALIESLGSKCAHCGNDDARVLAIHHINPETKRKPKDGQWNWTRRFKDWAANSGNLLLLCSNCHRILTWDQAAYGPGAVPRKSV